MSKLYDQLSDDEKRTIQGSLQSPTLYDDCTQHELIRAAFAHRCLAERAGQLGEEGSVTGHLMAEEALLEEAAPSKKPKKAKDEKAEEEGDS